MEIEGKPSHITLEAQVEEKAMMKDGRKEQFRRLPLGEPLAIAEGISHFTSAFEQLKLTLRARDTVTSDRKAKVLHPQWPS